MKTESNKSIKHWVVLFSLCGSVASAVGMPIMASGVFINPVSDSLNVLRGSFSIHNTISLIVGAVLALYIPMLLKKVPFKLLILTGTLLGVSSTIGFGFARSLLMFNLLGVVRGIGMGLFSLVLLVMIINNWFEEKHGLATSIVMSFSGVAGAVFSPLFSSLIISIGWQNTYFVMGGLMLICALPTIVIPFTLNPRDEGLLPYGHVPEDKESHKNEETLSSNKPRVNVSAAAFILMLIFVITQTTITGVPQHFPGFAEAANLSTQVGASMLSASMIGSVIFKLLVGYISDYVGSLKATITIISLNIIAGFVLIYLQPTFMLIIAAFFFGGVYSIPSVGVALLTKEFFGKENFNQLYPKISLVVGLGAAISISIVGFIYDFTGSYLNALLLAIVLNSVNILILFTISKITDRQVALTNQLNNI